LGGVNAAYDGLQLYLKKIKVRTYRWVHPEQRFFISWTTVWRTKSRDEAIKNQVKTDPHSVCTVRMYRLKMLMLLSGI
jgi:endothelin-converting enzyme/putative endopeptidase